MMEMKLEAVPSSWRILTDLPRKFVRALSRGLRLGAPMARKSAQQQFGGPGQLKVRSGTLKHSIKEESGRFEGSPFLGIFSTLEYAGIHEMGSSRRNMPARPYLEPGMRKSLSNIIMTIESELARALEK